MVSEHALGELGVPKVQDDLAQVSVQPELTTALDRLTALGASRKAAACDQLQALRPCEYDWLDEAEREELYRIQVAMREGHWADVRRARERVAERRARTRMEK